MKHVQKTETLLKSALFWKVRNLSAYDGFWWIGIKNKKVFGRQPVNTYPIPFCGGLLNLHRISFRPRANRLFWSVSALNTILKHPHMGLRINWIENLDGITISSTIVKDWRELQYEHNKAKTNAYPSVVAYSLIDGSEIGDPDFALWLIRQKIRCPRSHSNTKRADLGYLVGKDGMIKSWVSWNEYRQKRTFSVGDTVQGKVIDSLANAKRVATESCYLP